MTLEEKVRAYRSRKLLQPSQPAKSEVLPTTLTTRECIHLGSKIPGQPCGKPLFTCNKFNEVTTRFIKCDKATRHCATCESFEGKSVVQLPVVPICAPIPTEKISYGDVGKRHLIYHVLPVAGNGIWRKGIDALRMRWKLFTGKKIISVATGGFVVERVDRSEGVSQVKRRLGVESAKVVKDYLPRDCEVIEVQNDPNTWELGSWALLWKSILSVASPDDAILYAHAKGVTRKLTSPCHIWTDLLYTLNLDHWRLIERLLRSKPIVGSLLKRGHYFPGVIAHSRWHYSGNFWWTRAGVIKERLEKYPVPIDRWATEAWSGIGFHLSEAGEVFSPSKPISHLYSPLEMERVVADYDRWLLTHIPNGVDCVSNRNNTC